MNPKSYSLDDEVYLKKKENFENTQRYIFLDRKMRRDGITFEK